MTVIQIGNKQKSDNSAENKADALVLGFRLFFLAAPILSVVSMLQWLLTYSAFTTIPYFQLSPSQWHAHEMIFGYAMAVIAGFLLTAIVNWTGISPISNRSLFILFLLWLAARISYMLGPNFLLATAICDLLFMTYLLFAVAAPVLRSRQWKQIGVIAKVLLLLSCNLLFYLGAMSYLVQGVNWGLYGALYIIIALILTISARVMPGFIQNGIDYPVKIPQSNWIGKCNLMVFLGFTLNQLFLHNISALLITSLALFCITLVRLLQWHTLGIWRKPLLWSLFLSNVWINLGFLLFALSAFYANLHYLAIHAFTVGGIGLATLGMMARVTLGHTGRNIHSPSATTGYALFALAISVVVRVILPLFDPSNYAIWVLLSQIGWIAAFVLFFMSHFKMLAFE